MYLVIWFIYIPLGKYTISKLELKALAIYFDTAFYWQDLFIAMKTSATRRRVVKYGDAGTF
jgi:hypothetical protein